MPIGEPYVNVECDDCEEVSDPIALTSLAGRSWDMRNMAGRLRSMGWRVDGDQTICPECIEAKNNEQPHD